MDSLLDNYNLFTRLHVFDSENNELDWNKRSIKYNRRGDPYGFIRLQLAKDLVTGQDYRLVLDRDIPDTAGIHLQAERIINFACVDAGADKPGMMVVEDFESADRFSVSDPIGASETKLAASADKLFDSKSLQVTYDMSNRSLVEIMGTVSHDAQFYEGDTVGIHVWGDMSYHDLSAVFQSDEYVVDLPLGKIDFHGWRYMTAVIPPLDGPFRFVCLDLRKGNPLMGQTGVIRFDNMLRKEASGIDELMYANMKVNVDGGYIVVSADTWIQGVELLNIKGQRVGAAGGNCLNVSQVEHGVYLLRVHINGRTVTRKVVL